MKFVLSAPLSMPAPVRCRRPGRHLPAPKPDKIHRLAGRKILILTMKNGVVWQEPVPAPLVAGLRFSRSSWDVRGDQVCEDAQILRVVSTGAICALGKLSLQTTAPEKSDRSGSPKPKTPLSALQKSRRLAQIAPKPLRFGAWCRCRKIRPCRKPRPWWRFITRAGWPDVVAQGRRLARQYPSIHQAICNLLGAANAQLGETGHAVE